MIGSDGLPLFSACYRFTWLQFPSKLQQVAIIVEDGEFAHAVFQSWDVSQFKAPIYSAAQRFA